MQFLYKLVSLIPGVLLSAIAFAQNPDGMMDGGMMSGMGIMGIFMMLVLILVVVLLVLAILALIKYLREK